MKREKGAGHLSLVSSRTLFPVSAIYPSWTLTECSGNRFNTRMDLLYRKQFVSTSPASPTLRLRQTLWHSTSVSVPTLTLLFHPEKSEWSRCECVLLLVCMYVCFKVHVCMNVCQCVYLYVYMYEGAYHTSGSVCQVYKLNKEIWLRNQMNSTLDEHNSSM